jgi:hypothetical protein
VSEREERLIKHLEETDQMLAILVFQVSQAMIKEMRG